MNYLQKAWDFILERYDVLSASPVARGYALFFGGVVLLYLIFKIIAPFILHRVEKIAKKTKNDFDEFMVELAFKVRWPMCLILVLIGARTWLEIPHGVGIGIRWFLIVFVTYWTIKVVTSFVTYGVKKVAARKGPGAPALLPVFAKIVNVGIWIIGVVFVISNLGYQVTPLITGLGIGGIAIALAVQNILSDLFSSVSIYLDKPFKVGDFIVVGEVMGTVKGVGIKTTRITALSGEELVIPNRDIVNSTIQNFKKMQKRRVAFDIGVTYETKPAKLKKVPEIVEGIVDGLSGTEFGRVHLKKLADSSLNFEVVYFVLTNDYEEYMNIQQEINFALVEAFAKAKIEFAYPTQKVFVKR
jgi:small-conductance mechanosensitive channel